MIRVVSKERMIDLVDELNRLGIRGDQIIQIMNEKYSVIAIVQTDEASNKTSKG